MNTITINDLKILIGKINIIDIRSNLSFNNNHIDTAKNIEYSLLVSDPSKYLRKNEKYFIYCQKGIKSYKLCLYLNKIGYNVVNILGGYEGWILEK